MRLSQICLFLLVSHALTGQIVENFTDGDFTTNPQWVGTTNDFIVNGSKELQTNLTVAGNSYLATPHGSNNFNDFEWHFRVRQTFSPSGSNYGRFYLSAVGNNPTTQPDGVYIQLGEAGSADAVRLFRSSGGNSTLICSGAAGAIANSFNIGIRVVRSANGDWSLFTTAHNGSDFQLQQTTNDANAVLGDHLIWQCVYTASNAQKFFLDSIYAGPEIVDTVPPQMLQLNVLSPSSIQLIFDEPIDSTAAVNPSHYSVAPTLLVQNAIWQSGNNNQVVLNFTTPMVNGTNYVLMVDQVQDLSGNISGLQSRSFFFVLPEEVEPGDVVINEFMCDPTPVIGLPEVEYVEIYNRSNKYLRTHKWKLGDASSQGTLGDTILPPAAYLVLTATSSVPLFSQALGVTSFPSLNNSGDRIYLTDSLNQLLDDLSYTLAWYRDKSKEQGGYSIEKINPYYPCQSPSNWRASVANLGGTPGQQNSVLDTSMDLTAPLLLSATLPDANSIRFHFSEPVDSALWVLNQPVISPNLGAVQCWSSTRFSDTVFILFPTPLDSNTWYQYAHLSAQDCSGNSAVLNGIFALGKTPMKGDLVINEILFDPVTGGSDYVEIYNRSDNLLSLKNLKVGTWKGDTLNYQKLWTQPTVLRPAEYFVFTEDIKQVQMQYPHHGTGFGELDLPTYANDSGVVVIGINETVLDRVDYFDDWHFRLLDSKDGKSLERLQSHVDAQRPDNWHTAAESVGFGTPGLENSQRIKGENGSRITVNPARVSPDNDGFEDVLAIQYYLEAPSLLKVVVYNQSGEAIRTIVANELTSLQGTLTWDGLTDGAQKTSIGRYLLYVEAFSLDGKFLFAEKKGVVVAGNLD